MARFAMRGTVGKTSGANVGEKEWALSWPANQGNPTTPRPTR